MEETMTKKMCRIIGSSRNIVVVGTNSESIKAFFDFAALRFAGSLHGALPIGVEYRIPEHYLDAVHGPASGKLNAQ
jgi:hypothetical protein